MTVELHRGLSSFVDTVLRLQASQLRDLVPRALAELIPLAADGLDALRRAYIVVQFPPQPRDATVDGAVEAIELESAQLPHQVVTAHHFARADHQCPQQIEFRRCQFRRAAVRQLHAAARAAYLKLAECEAVRLAGRVGDAASLAAQLRLDACQQDARLDRLVNIVVRTEFEAQHFVELVVAGGHHDDHAVEVLACLTTDLEAVLARQVDVEDHEVGLAFEDGRNRVVAVKHDVYLVIMFAQIAGDQRGQALVVFHEKNPEGHEWFLSRRTGWDAGLP